MRLINIGFGNMISVDRIAAVVNPDSAPIKRLIQEARDEKRLLDATQGRRTRAVILLSSNQIVLSAIQPETISSRASSKDTEERQD
jgi:extracellular matrix regulatory protein A